MSMPRSSDRGLRLVVVPADPLAIYEEKGRGALLRDYYNPAGSFDEVFALSPREVGTRRAHGMTVEGVAEQDFSRRLRELRPDLVRAYGGAWAADLCARRRVGRTPVVASVHNTDHRIRAGLRYLDQVFCVSEDVARCVREVGVQPSRIRLLPNRVDASVFRPVADPQQREALERRFPPGRRILLVGRAARQKNRDTLIRALRHLPDTYRLIAVGRGDLEADRALAQRQGVSDRLHLVEFVPNEELPLWYSFADCLCNPSRWEGFGIVFVEAAACGAAIVASDLAVTRALFRTEHDALLVEAFEDPQAVARDVRRACEDPELRARLKRNAPAAAAPFAKEAVDAREAQLYGELIASGGPGVPRRLEIAAWQAWHRDGMRGTRRRIRAALGQTRTAVAP
jgi:glycosyltransferase involved in cell wall biosynthesis